MNQAISIKEGELTHLCLIERGGNGKTGGCLSKKEPLGKKPGCLSQMYRDEGRAKGEKDWG